MSVVPMRSDHAQRAPLTAAESEVVLAGAFLREPKILSAVLAAVEIAPDDFTLPLCKTVYEVLKTDYQKGVPLDADLLLAKIRDKVGNANLGALYRVKIPEPQVCAEHAKRVRLMSLLRRFRSRAGEMLKNPTGEKVAEVTGILTEIINAEKGKPARVYDAALNILADLGKPLKGIKYDFCDLDEWTGGMKPGEYVVLAGRPGMGKSSFATQLALNCARRGKRVAFFSPEVSTEQVVHKILAMLSGLSAQSIRMRRVGLNDLRERIETLAKVPLFVYDDGRQTPVTIRATSLSMQSGEGLDLVVVDYLQLLKSDNKQVRGYDEITAISAEMKRLAKELKVPVLVVSQLNRESEDRNDKRPVLSDLRGSGAIEQDADTVIFLYRERYYRKDADNAAEIILAKQREGPTGTAYAVFDPETTMFKEYNPFENHA